MEQKSSFSSEQSEGVSIEDCLKLLRGERDEQRLAGLLLVTKFCNKDDHPSIRKVYDAVGPRFLERLLRTGMGKGNVDGGGGENWDSYLQLSVTILAAFCRVPDIATSEHMVSKVPLILEVMSKESSGSSVIDECYEFLYLVATAHDDGVAIFHESRGLHVLASQMTTLPDGSRAMELAMKLVQQVVSKSPLYNINNEYPSEVALMVATIARQFAVLHNAMKFEALHLLSAILSSKYSAPVHDALRSMKNDIWSAHIRVGVMAILQNRVASKDKLQALILAESVTSNVGEQWLILQNQSEIQDLVPADRCMLLILESARVEIAVLLNELAYLKYEASNSSSTFEGLLSKQRDLGVAFSLVEKIIKLVSNVAENEACTISETTLTKIISGLNETICVVLDYIKDAKDHGLKKGDDLLASVRIVGSYLAQTPHASKEKVRELLDYMLLIESEDESSPFYSIWFLLPMLCQITMEIDGCMALASSGAYKAVVECLNKLMVTNCHEFEDNGSVLLAFDTILNLLLKRDQIRYTMEDSSFVKLLGVLSHSTDIGDPCIIMMASSICALILDSMSEEALLHHPNFDRGSLVSLSQLFKRSFAICGQDVMSDDAKEHEDLHQIVISGYSRWADRFPHIKDAVEG